MPNSDVLPGRSSDNTAESTQTRAAADNLDSVRLPLPEAREAGTARSAQDNAAKAPDDSVISPKEAALVPDLTIVEPGKTIREKTKLDGQDRQYFLHLPKDYDPSRSYPLVLVYNGWGNHTGQGGVPGGAEGMEKTTGMSERADKDGFIVAYMDGTPRDQHSWNNGEWYFSKENDVKYTTQTMDAISQNANVDQSRIYLAGYSQGGSFAHRAATELSDRIAAVATVGGWLTGLEKPPSESVSVLEIHAGKDPTVPYDGRVMWCTMKPHEYLKDFYLKADKMPSEHETTIETTATGFQAITEDWKNPTTGAEVKMISLPEVNKHEYYGGFGATVNPVDTTDQFLSFFKNHQRQSTDHSAVPQVHSANPGQ
ncbi:MAG: acetylxylan esterase [Cyanobacteria bacterium REEB67]|nr:acetylxylan esterase [Cyanobacteria bacterium REEB67]